MITPRPVIADNIIRGNVAMYGGRGGGIYSASNCLIINNLVAQNVAEGIGAGIMIEYMALSTVLNNVIFKNVGVGLYCNDNPEDTTGYNCYFGNTGTFVGCNDMGSNIFADPRFVDYDNGDYHLLSASPLINAGFNHGGLPEEDFEGQPRIIQDRVDIGPDEFADCDITSDFTAVPLTGCNPLNVRFDSYAQGRYDSLQWDFGDGQFAYNSTQVFHSYTDTGSYTARLIVVTPCTTAVAVKVDSIRVLDPPVADFAVSGTSGCAPLLIGFTNLSTGDVSDWFWDFGDDSTSTLSSPYHEYLQEGVYTVKLRVQNDCTLDSVVRTEYVTVSGQAHADFVAQPQEGPAPLEAQFTDLSVNEPFEWSWDFGDGGVSAEQHPLHEYIEPGLYNVWLASLNECGTFDTLSLEDYIRVYGFELNITDSSHQKYVKSFMFDIDTLYGQFDRDVSLRAILFGLPRRGRVSFTFDDSTMTVGSSSQMHAYLTEDLARGIYSGKIVATASGGSPVAIDTFWFESTSDSIISVSADSLHFDSTEVGITAVIPLTITNLSSFPDTLLELSVMNITTDPPLAFGVEPTSFVVQPSNSADILVSFSPPDTNEYTAVMTIISDDPAYPEYEVHLSGIGVIERVPPYVRWTTPDSAETDFYITSEIEVMISEPLDTLTLAPNSVVITSSQTGAPVDGTMEYLPTSWGIQFVPGAILNPLDSFTVLVSGVLKDSAGNSLDGDRDGIGEGSPQDDYWFWFRTGPGVYPGDANNDGIVNEVDVLPLGVYWRTTGPGRPGDDLTGWFIQPANSWEELGATYADCNGDGTVNEADLSVIEANWGLIHAMGGPVHIFTNSDLIKFQGAFEAIYFELGDGSDDAASLAIRDLIRKYVEVESGPDRFSLAQNYPNPFNPTTYIQFNLPTESHVTLTIHNILGQTVATLLDEAQDAGYRQVVWHGKSDAGESLPSGIYFYRLTAGSFTSVKKMMMLR
jgi:PKD repeat protein